MTRQHHTAAGTQVGLCGFAVARSCALVAALALSLAAGAPAAFADEVGGGGSFELNLSMRVSPADDPDAEVHPVAVHVTNHLGEHVGSARVSYELRSAYAVASADASAAAALPLSAPAAAEGSSSATRATSGMVRSGTAVTAEDGTADLEGIVAGCDYLVSIEADGHTRYERVHTCKGTGDERWEIVMEKIEDSGGGSDAGGSSGGDSGSNPAGAGGSGAGSSFPLSTLTRTGDALAPLALGAVGALFAAVSLVLLARGRRDARNGR